MRLTKHVMRTPKFIVKFLLLFKDRLILLRDGFLL